MVYNYYSITKDLFTSKDVWNFRKDNTQMDNSNNYSVLQEKNTLLTS